MLPVTADTDEADEAGAVDTRSTAAEETKSRHDQTHHDEHLGQVPGDEQRPGDGD